MRSEKRRAMSPRVIGSSTFQTNVSIFLLKKILCHSETSNIVIRGQQFEG